MFRLTTLLAIILFFSSATFADDGDWGIGRHQNYRRDNYGYNYNSPRYRTYAPPPVVGYYQAPADYYRLPPVRGFVYQQPIRAPRCDRNIRRGW